MRGRVQLPDESEQYAFWEVIEELTRPYGFELYEISNLAMAGHESRHNQGYWQGHAYLGLGAGAHSLELPQRWEHNACARRIMNARQPKTYMDLVSQNGHAEEGCELLDCSTHLKERMFTGLRQTEGVCLSEIASQLGIDPRLEFASQLQALQAQKLVEINGEQLALTPRGMRYATDVFLRFF